MILVLTIADFRFLLQADLIPEFEEYFVKPAFVAAKIFLKGLQAVTALNKGTKFTVTFALN